MLTVTSHLSPVGSELNRGSKMLPRKTKPGVESLELRENPAMVIQGLNEVMIYATDANGSNVTVTRSNPWDNLKITDNVTGQVTTIPQGLLDNDRVTFFGGSKNDVFNATNAMNPITAYGQGGNDTLTGGLMGDYLDGGDGGDKLYGGYGNDTMYGRAGIDYLYGQSGDDFLDDGGNSVVFSGGVIPIILYDYSDGGAGYDFLARQPVVDGTKNIDVNQTQTPSCWIDAPLAAAAKAGVNLASRITYLGDGDYQVKLLDANNVAHYQIVSLEGGRLSFEPATNGDESWVILYQRAIQQQLGKDWHHLSDYSGGWPSSVLPFLTGSQVYGHGNQVSGGGFNTTNDAEMQNIKNDLNAGMLVCACTRQGDYGSWNIAGSVSTGKLCGAHCYAVDSVDMVNRKITLYNPWGVDQDGGDDPHVKWYDGDNDGFVTITFDQFYDSMWSYAAS